MRKASCKCGECKKCKKRIAAKAAYQAMSDDERRAWVAKRDLEKIRARDRARSKEPERRAQNTANTKRWRAANPEKSAAHSKVAHAVVKGVLVRQPCEKCGAKQVHAHHDDYSKPLEVRWLCPKHHAEERSAPTTWQS